MGPIERPSPVGPSGPIGPKIPGPVGLGCRLECGDPDD